MIDMLCQSIGWLPFEWAANPFFQRALLGLLFLAPLAAMVGVQVVQFRMAYFADAVGHSAFTGIALGVVFHLDIRLTVVAFALTVGLFLSQMRRQSKLPLDTLIGVLYAFIVALGIALMSARKGLGREFQSFLYGDILAIRAVEIHALALIFGVIGLYMFFSFNRLLSLSVNADMAHVNGVRTKLHGHLVNLMVALLVAFGIRAVGILLISAMLIVPAAAARHLAKSQNQWFWLTLVICILSVLIGFGLSIVYGSATGATIILVSVGFFVLATMLRKFY